jgi:hypothetical protein|tara:strand:- start:3695 stop:3874 length:180 start_codon:yes stop_codon:yes gene_type:complete
LRNGRHRFERGQKTEHAKEGCGGEEDGENKANKHVVLTSVAKELTLGNSGAAATIRAAP